MARGKRKPPVGARPGTLIFDASMPAPRVHVIQYDEASVHERDVEDLAQLPGLLAEGKRCWVDVQGLGDEAKIEQLGQTFSIHPLALEDLVHASIRPKSEVYADNLLIITRMLRVVGESDVHSEQVGIVLGEHWVVTFQETYGDVLDPVRARLRAGNTPIRTLGSGYLAYAILDTIVDAYFPVIDHLGDVLEELEERVMATPTPAILQRLNDVRAELLRMRRAVGPQREAVNSMIRDPNRFLSEETRLYLRDTYDHCVVSAEAVESGREMINGLVNTYLSVVSNRTNEVMKTLTIVASIFVPLTFLAGLYGMNFDNMPELHWRWGYPVVLAAMLLLGAVMLAYFRSKGWLGGAVDDDDD